VVSGTEAAELLPRGKGTLPPAEAPGAPLPSLPNAAPATSTSGFRPRVDRPLREQVEEAEREIILHMLAHTQDNVTEAARLLDLERGHFYKKMKALGIRRG
ncbi:MAG TPA: helix-turn-helix domain-containing protein, partial [Myxococcaceae bacterium]|nr:helix-turn-helix domain-containing protein [Myxococcaceae bacterium]